MRAFQAQLPAVEAWLTLCDEIHVWLTHVRCTVLLSLSLSLSSPRNFDEALRFSHEGVEDSLVNWLGLVAILAVGIVPILIMQRNRTKPVKKRREVFVRLQAL